MSTAPPPIQNPSDRCPNCGAYRPVTQAYCANCGFGKPSGSNNTAQIVWIVLFILIGLPAGCFGSCLLLIGMSMPPNADDWSFWLLTLGSVGVAIALLVMMIVSLRKRR
jgi:hypothetical protein